MPDIVTADQWTFYEDNGYVSLGRLLDGANLTALQDRIDQIMLGTADVDYDRMLMQLDSRTGKPSDAGRQTNGFKGATLGYRKIQDLEFDALFLRYIQRAIFRDLCRRVYGDVPIACFRAMFMNKPARRGTYLPWHQDRWSYLDRDPLITIWTAFDPATVPNGCVQIIPGSHKNGLINRANPSGFLSEEQIEQHCPKDQVKFLELEAGEVVLLHNWLLHSSDINNTDTPRRAFSTCYMDARTKRTDREADYSLIFDS